MVAIEIRFPTGRYHATAWDRHVNEGLIEWPPSPWRLLRSLIAVRELKADGEVELATLDSLLAKLSEQPPHYRLPASVAFHTRHYMPTDGKPTKVLDGFLRLASGADDDWPSVTFLWPEVALVNGEQAALALLLKRLAYFGRAESWAEGRVVEDDELGANVFPLADTSANTGTSISRVLAPVDTTRYEEWRSRYRAIAESELVEQQRVKAVDKGKDPDKAELTAAQRKQLEALLPASLPAALRADIDTLRKQGWSRPPGSQWVDYAVPEGLLDVSPQSTTARRTTLLPTTARFAVSSAVAPLFTDALRFTEQLRRALLQKTDDRAAAELAGKSSNGTPLEGHEHLYVLPEANERDGRVSHIVLHKPSGLSREIVEGIRRLREIWQRGPHDVRLILMGVGSTDSFAGLDASAGQCPLLATATHWVSRTPFVSTRHPKVRKNGKPKLNDFGEVIGGPTDDLRRLLSLNGFPQPVSIEAAESTSLRGRPTRWGHFTSRRKQGRGRRGPFGPVGFQLAFDEPVSGPIALGYAAHFGLGLFVPRDPPASA